MFRAKITDAGQLSIPAEIRRRWEATFVTIEDNDDHIVVRPAPADPIAAFRGSLSDTSISSDESRRLGREEEGRIERRKERSRGRQPSR